MMKGWKPDNSTHGAIRFWQRGILSNRRKVLAANVDLIISTIREDMGGNLSVTQDVLLGQLRKCMIFQALIDKWLSEQKQFIDGQGELPGCLSGFYLSVMNTSIRICERLGLERKAGGETLEQYLAKKRQIAPGCTNSPPPSPRKGGAAKGDCVRPEAQGGDE